MLQRSWHKQADREDEGWRAEQEAQLLRKVYIHLLFIFKFVFASFTFYIFSIYAMEIYVVVINNN